jgi:hypothetical protein
MLAKLWFVFIYLLIYVFYSFESYKLKVLELKSVYKINFTNDYWNWEFNSIHIYAC